jgi:hypothetical protein
MSTPSTSLPTRQQLDEIDALLQRMLSLPGLPGEAPEPPSAPAVTYPAPAVREVPPPRDPAPGEPVVREWRVEWSAPSAPPAPSVVAWGAPVPAAAADQPPRFDPAPAPVYAQPVPAELPFAAPVPNVPGQPPASSLKPPVALPVRVLMLVNGTFNLLTYLLGPPGTWLRGPGRNALGWCGFLMLLAAAGWAAGEWYGIDWPKPDLSRFGWPPAGQ